LDGRYINKSLDVRMLSRLGDDHPAITVSDQDTRTGLVEDATCRGHVGVEGRLGLLNNANGIAVAYENIRDRLPSATIGEGTVDENDSFDSRVRGR
jgi:hypothetical protein